MAQFCVQRVCWAFLSIAAMLSFILQSAMATQYAVGGSAGWGVSGFDYSNWASKNTYHVGDTLYFAYEAGSHSVLQLSEQDYQSCSTSNAIASDNGGGKKVVDLKTPGKYYFACGVLGHCGDGMKFSITVSGGSSSSRSTPSTSSSTPSSSDSTPALTSSAVFSIANQAKAALIMANVGLIVAYLCVVV